MDSQTDPLAPFVELFNNQLLGVQDALLNTLETYEHAHPGINLLVYKIAADSLVKAIEHRIQEATNAWIATKDNAKDK